MKSIKSIAIFFAIAMSVSVASAQNLTATVDVISVTPHYETINTQRQNCDRVSQQQSNRGSNGLVTALSTIGGAGLGNQIGNGNGKTLATVIGGIAGYNAATEGRNDGYQSQCYVENIPVQRQNGFNVTYVFLNRQMVMYSPVDPGPRMQINVSVTPMYPSSRW